MRFHPLPRYEGFNWTPRKQALAASRPARELAKARAALPLLVDQLPEPAPVDLDALAARRQTLLAAADARMRALTARYWREARRDYFAATQAQRAAIHAAWAAWRGPLTALYFRYVVDLHTGVVEARSQAFRLREGERRAVAAESVARQGVLQLGGGA